MQVYVKFFHYVVEENDAKMYFAQSRKIESFNN